MTNNIINIMIDTKYFTPNEAIKTLPLVRKIVEDILNEGRELKLLAEDLDGKVEGNPAVQYHLLNIQKYIDELSEIGCFYKDWNFNLGLVDFPAIINGKEVFLCWKSDEDTIRYFHDIDTGFINRKLIPEEYYI
ncbi:MAG: DUF2203 family protein [Ignavibacterium sp.]